MFTRDSKILSHRLTTPLTSVANAVGDVFKPTYNQIIKSLFAGGEQGFAYDINDLSTLFQDAAGTIPVTGAGQPVGLMLDKSKGLVLGSEKWSDTAALFAGGSSRVGANTYRIYTSDTTYSAVYTPNVLTIGKLYKLTFNIDSITQPGMGISVEGNPTTVFTTTGQKSVYFFANTITAAIKRASSACDVQISNISIKEIAGNHAYQTTAASRPLLQRNATTGAYYLEFDGSDDFLQTSNIDFTSTDKMSLFAGVRKLSDAAAGCLVETGAGGIPGSISVFAPISTSGNYFFRIYGASGNDSLTATTFNAPITNVLSCSFDNSLDGVSNTVKPRINGSTPSLSLVSNTATPDKYGNLPLYIGRRAGTSLPFNGHIYSLIGVGRLSTDNEMTAIEKELAKCTGVTLSV